MAADEKNEKVHKNLTTAKQKDNDIVEIPIGDYISKMRKNPWILLSIILFIALIAVFFWKSSVSSEDIVSEKVAAQNVISLIVSQGKGIPELVSSKKVGPFYEVIIKFNGNEIPLHVTSDGNFAVINLVPLTQNAPALAQPKAGNTVVNNKINNKINITIGDSPTKGNKDAKAVIIDFTDYQCKDCKNYYNNIYSPIIKDYINQGKVLYVIKDFPMVSVDPESQRAAEAARCVREQQGDIGYFRMYEKLFENQENLSFANYVKLASQVGVLGPKFTECLDSGKYASAVRDDLEYGKKLGITGVPIIFINGVPVSGSISSDDLKKIIDTTISQ